MQLDNGCFLKSSPQVERVGVDGFLAATEIPVVKGCYIRTKF